MTAVKVGQVWKDKDKRRNTVIEIIRVMHDEDGGATGLVVGTEEERTYSTDRLLKRWELVKDVPRIIVPGSTPQELEEARTKLKATAEDPTEISLSDAAETVREQHGELKLTIGELDVKVVVPERTRAKQPVYQLKLISPENPDYKLRMTMKMIDDYGFPFDPWGNQMELT